MKRAYTNGILLDGTEQMEPVRGKVLLTENDKITAIADASVSLDGYEVIDLHGGYLCPGLINLHVHLAGTQDPEQQADPRHRIPAGVQLCPAGAAGRSDHRAHRGRHCGL